MSQVNTKLLDTEQPLSSTSDSVSDMSQVNTDNAKSECISDPEICALLDSQSVKQKIPQSGVYLKPSVMLTLTYP